MDERKTPRPKESTPDKPVQADAPKAGGPAFARGSGHISSGLPSVSGVLSVPPVPPVAPVVAPVVQVAPAASVAPVATEISGPTENSVMEGLPPAKAERIAAMRRDLAELQRQLIEAQQRIATELQGRADDAERVEALEARLQAQEVKLQQDAARTAPLEKEISGLRSQLSSAAAKADELRREVAARDRELAKETAEHDTERATRARLERELEDQRKHNREVTAKLESQRASLRDATALITTREAELTASAAERDALKGEVAAARAKVRDVADQLARFGQDLTEGVGGAQTDSNSEPNAAAIARNAERPKPPPVPTRAATATTGPHQIETILEVTEQPKPKWLIPLVLSGGVILGCVATIAVVKLAGSSSSAANQRQEVGALAPPALAPPALAPERAPEPTTTSVPTTASVPVLAVAAPGMLSAQPTPISGTAATGRPNDKVDVRVTDRPNDKNDKNDKIDSRPAAPAEVTKDGVIVLPEEAAQHRLYVDGRVVPVKKSRATVPCGTHEIRIGSRGAPQTLEVACGGETTVPTN